MTKRDFLETWFKRVRLDEDIDAVDEVMSSNAPIEGLGRSTQMGTADFKAFAKALLSQICETQVSIDDFMEDGARVSVLMNITVKCRKTGKPLCFSGLVMGQIENSKITEVHNVIDFLGLFEELGLIPPNSLAHGLSGAPLA